MPFIAAAASDSLSIRRAIIATFSLKSKIVIEAIKGELTIAQISSKYGVHSTQIQQWKKKGLEYLMSGFQNIS